MEKRNTMLLTVIAVATLLVAVVGATFAYFSLSATSESNTTGTVTTPKIGTVKVTSENNNLQLTLTAEDMVKGQEDKPFYATVNGVGGGSSNPIVIAKADLTDGEEGATYECKVDVVVKLSDPGLDIPNMADKLESGWAKLTLNGTGVNKEEKVIDLFTLKNDEDGEKYTGTATVTGPEQSVNILTAVLEFINLKDTPQNAVAGTTLKVDVTVTGSTCTLQKGD